MASLPCLFSLRLVEFTSTSHFGVFLYSLLGWFSRISVLVPLLHSRAPFKRLIARTLGLTLARRVILRSTRHGGGLIDELGRSIVENGLRGNDSRTHEFRKFYIYRI
jgi:hypothetical protein